MWNCLQESSFRACLVSGLLLCLGGCQVGQPGVLQTRIIQGTKRHFTVRGRDDKNPLAATPENIRAGQNNFGAYCTSCHGLDGQNTGVPFADKMDPPVPLLTSSPVQEYTDGQLHWIIQKGISPSGMPASQGLFHDDEVWQIVLYLRHLPPKGSLGEPQAYGGTGAPKGQN
jgi:S-disulfanyl-L-cysteine oxidoreductase SoxD